MTDDMAAYMRTPLTAEQVEDLQACLSEWIHIRKANGRAASVTAADVAKSCLLGRMTIEGKPPLPDPPPTAYSAPWYGLIETGRVTLGEWDVTGPHAVPVVRRYMLICQHPWTIVENCTDGWFVQSREVSEPWLLRRAGEVVGPSARWELIGPTHYLGELHDVAAQTPTSSASDVASA